MESLQRIQFDGTFPMALLESRGPALGFFDRSTRQCVLFNALELSRSRCNLTSRSGAASSSRESFSLDILFTEPMRTPRRETVR